MTLVTKSKLPWLAVRTPPANLRQAAGEQWELAPCDPLVPLKQHFCDGGVAVLHASGPLADPVCLAAVLEDLQRSSAVAVILVTAGSEAAAELSGRNGQFLCLDDNASPAELRATISAAASLQPAIRQLRAELDSARQATQPSSEKAEALDQELRLASRLQRDFLPRRLPEVGAVRFAVLYRPAEWVGGDIYDVARLDETHVGFYVADAVGHGLPAALLTMFIKKAFQTKRIIGNTYQIVTPESALGELNTDIFDQQLSGSPFCTAVYAVIDTASLILTFARAGHPEPVLIRPDGTCQTLPSRGTLLGVFPDETFPPQQQQLNPGDRLVLYSDGVEPLLQCEDRHVREPADLFASWAGRGREEILLGLNEQLDAAPAESRQADDITVLIMDIQR